jgi:lipopolysaccharide export system permease protein
MYRIIDRYILREIATPSIMVLFVLTFVLLMGKILQLMDLMINKGVSFFDIALLIVSLLPSFLVFTIPISLLIAILIGLGRLSGDNETIIFRASGISLNRLSYPVAVASLIAFVMTALTSLFLVPQGNQATKNLLFNIAKQKASIGIKEKVFNDDFKGILLYAENIPVRGNFMEGVIVSDNRITSDPSTIIAKRAYLISDPRSMVVTLRLENGSTHSVDMKLRSYRKMDFTSYDINLDLESALAQERKSKSKQSSEMTVKELMENLSRPGLGREALTALAIELNKKLTIPFSCFVFGLIGIPLGIRAHRAVKSRGFTLGLLIVVLYYIIQLCGDALVETGRLPVLTGTWAANAILGILGLGLYFLTVKERSFGYLFTIVLRRLKKILSVIREG